MARPVREVGISQLGTTPSIGPTGRRRHTRRWVSWCAVCGPWHAEPLATWSSSRSRLIDHVIAEHVSPLWLREHTHGEAIGLAMGLIYSHGVADPDYVRPAP